MPRLSIDPAADWIQVGERQVPLRLVHNERARRYILRLAADGTARVTIPRGGNAAAAVTFARKHQPWIERQLLRRSTEAVRPRDWPPGTVVLVRGEPQTLALVEVRGAVVAILGDWVIPLRTGASDLRPTIERHLWRLAARELPPRVFELATLHGLTVGRVTVRNQRSRWGSCSRRGTISLNWRIIQAPVFVRDYLILHELMHLRHMNHSVRFWQAVQAVCPDYEVAEDWLKRHASLLR